MLSRSLRADVKFDNESDSKFSFFWWYGIDSWMPRCWLNSRSASSSSNIFLLGGRGSVEATALTSFDDFGGRGGGKCLVIIGDGARRIGASWLLNSVSEVLSDMLWSSARDREILKNKKLVQSYNLVASPYDLYRPFGVKKNWGLSWLRAVRHTPWDSNSGTRPKPTTRASSLQRRYPSAIDQDWCNYYLAESYSWAAIGFKSF